MDALLLMSLFLLKHFIADFILQSQYQYEAKRHYARWGGILHALNHAIGTAMILCYFNWQFALAAALADGGIHYHVDWMKEFIIHRRGLTVKNRWYWIIFGFDQFIHQMTYIIIILIFLK